MNICTNLVGVHLELPFCTCYYESFISQSLVHSVNISELWIDIYLKMVGCKPPKPNISAQIHMAASCLPKWRIKLIFIKKKKIPSMS